MDNAHLLGNADDDSDSDTDAAETSPGPSLAATPDYPRLRYLCRCEPICLISGIIARAVIIIVCVIFIVISLYFIIHPIYDKNEPKFVQVGGSVPVEIELNEDDKFVILNISLSLNNTFAPDYAIIYCGSIDDVSIKTTKLPKQSLSLNLTPNETAPANYNADYPINPIYVLSGSNLTYKTTTITNSSKQGCAFIYLFDNTESYDLFLNGYHNYAYYDKSDCITITDSAHTVTSSYTFNITDDLFLFGAVSTNVSASMRIQINGSRKEYNVSLLKSIPMARDEFVVDLRKDHEDCFDHNDEKQRLYIESPQYTNGTAQSEVISKSTYAIIGGVVGGLLIIAVTIIIVASICSIKSYKINRSQHKVECLRIIVQQNITVNSQSANGSSVSDTGPATNAAVRPIVVCRLLKDIPSDWDNIGQSLEVPFEFRDELRKDGGRNNNGKLEAVINKWYQSQCSPVTWDRLIEALDDTGHKKTIEKIQTHLQT